MLKNDISIQALILAAGASNRMGSPKLSLAFDKKHSFIEQIINQYDAFGCTEIWSVINADNLSFYKKAVLSHRAKYILNKQQKSSRFYSLQLGLQAMKNTQAVFVHNVDNPFVEQDVLRKMMAQLGTADYITPRYKGKGGHPILLTKKMVHAILNAKGSNYVLSDFIKTFHKKTVEVPYASILTNINTPEAYAEFVRKKERNLKTL